MKDKFIEQTAKDYDMSYDKVEQIVKNNPDNFYEKLEEHIKERSKLGVVKDNLEPIESNFILENGVGVMGNDGMYYHFAEVVRLLKIYKK